MNFAFSTAKKTESGSPLFLSLQPVQTSADYSAVAKEPLDGLCAFSSVAINDGIILGGKKTTKNGKMFQVIIFYFDFHHLLLLLCG